jgi:hypothetical protein
MGAIGTFQGLCGTHRLMLTGASFCLQLCKRELRQVGRWELLSMSTHIGGLIGIHLGVDD